MAKSRSRFNWRSLCSRGLYDDSGLHDHRNVAQNLGILEGIAAHGDQISHSAWRDGADIG